MGFHAKRKPSYKELTDKQNCDILGKCYYDGSCLRGDDDGVVDIFINHGEEGIWKYLEKYYNEVFGNGTRRNK